MRLNNSLRNTGAVALSLALCLCSFSSRAQSFPALNFSPDAAVAGMGATSVASSASAYSLDNNFAASALDSRKLAVGAGYGVWQPSATNAGLLSASGYLRLGERISAGLGYKGFSYQSYNAMSLEGQTGKSFTPKESAVGLGFAYRISDCFSAGLGLKMVSSSLAEEAKASAFSADLSFMYTKDAFRAGLALCNFGTQLSYGDSGYALPSIVKAGAAYSLKGLTAAAQLDFMLKSGVGAGLGLEYSLKDFAFFRAGYRYGSGDNAIPSAASLGLGLSVAGIRLDASYFLASETLSGTAMINLSYAF